MGDQRSYTRAAEQATIESARTFWVKLAGGIVMAAVAVATYFRDQVMATTASFSDLLP